MTKDCNAPKPLHARFRVEYRPGAGHVVLDPEGRAAFGPTPFREAAERDCAAMQAEADRKAGRGPRACLCCGATFRSAGHGNRLCKPCRAAVGRLPAQMAG